MIKIILFSFDGVLTTNKSGPEFITDYLSKAAHIHPEVIKKAYYMLNNRLISGEGTHEQLWSEFCKGVRETVDYKLIIDCFHETPLDMKMLNLVKDLRNTYKIGLVTNDCSDRINKILNFHNIRDLFDSICISSDYKATKDSEKLFKAAYKKVKGYADECLYIDNIADNLKIPQSMEMKTMLFNENDRNFYMFRNKLIYTLTNLR